MIPERVLTAEHGELVLKKHRSSLSKKENKRLRFIRWQLDRVYDAADASSMDGLELMVEQHESFSEQLNAIKEYAEIEVMFTSHGGDINILMKKARELAQTTTMSFRQASEYVIKEDSVIRQEPVGFLTCFEQIEKGENK